ncbi:MAG TPA: TonB-dependent receptor [Steroidobacteraceae bacterium]|nr:TonB-dependent receptor [Steroidobacteraceae bacterium]
MHISRSLYVSVALAVVCGTVSAVQAADPADTPSGADDDAGRLSEVLVTARKRGEETAQSIPTAITAIGSAQLDAMGVRDFTDFAYSVPGLTFNDQGAGEKRYIIRGVFSPGQEQVAVYYDEVPAPGIQSSTGDSGSQTPDLKLVDMDRIEVLKGPQGTTFGANSQTGVVRFITKKPSLTEVTASVDANAQYMQHGNPGGGANGTFNLPLIQDVLGVRLTAYYDRTGGYIDNVRLGNDDINWSRTEGGRALVRYQPQEGTTIDAMLWLQNRDIGGANNYYPYDSFHVRGTGPSNNGYNDHIPNFAYFNTGEYNTADYVQTPLPDKQQIYSLTLTQDVKFATLTATGSFYKRNFGFFRDNTWAVISLGLGPAALQGTPNCFKNAAAPNAATCIRGDLFPELTNQTQDITQKSGEIRLNSNGDGPLGWLAGFFYRDRDSNFQSVSPVVDPDTGLPFPVTSPPAGYSALPGAGITGCQPCALARYNERTIKEHAEFGELTYRFFSKFEAMVGLREFSASQTDTGFYLFQFPTFGNTLPAPAHGHFTENKLIKKFQLSYRPWDDMTVFALASQGFRLGGTNQSTFAAVPKGYGADSLWNYELGVKSQWLDKRVTVNVSAFDIEWDNIQVSGRDPTGSFGFISNAGKARVTGLEFETFVHPVRGFDVSAGFSYLPKRELTQDEVNNVVVAPGKAGDKLPRIPEFTGDLGAQYTRSLSALPDWAAWARVDYSYHGRSATDFRPTSTGTYRIQHAYDLTNFRFGATDEKTGLNLALYVDNVFDVAGEVYVVAATATPTAKYTNQPRTIGLEVTKRF